MGPVSFELTPAIAELLPTPQHQALLAMAIQRAIVGATRGENLSEAAARDLARKCLRIFAELGGVEFDGVPWTFQRVLDHLESALRLDLAGSHLEPRKRKTWGRGATDRVSLCLASGDTRPGIVIASR